MDSHNSLDKSDFESSTSSIMHLPLPKDIETGIGATKEAINTNNTSQIKEEPPDVNHHVLFGRKYVEAKDPKPREIVKQFKQGVLEPAPLKPSKEENYCILRNILLKENPPDVSTCSPTIHYQGKTLNSQNRMKPNLLSLGADKSVLRTKLFEEGGYDAVIKPKTSTNSQAAEPDSRDGPKQPLTIDHADIQALIKAFQTIQSDSSAKINFYVFLTQLSNSQKLIQPKRCPEMKVMDFKSWPFYDKAFCATTPTIGQHSPAQVRPTIRTTWKLFLGLLRFQQAQEQLKQPSDQRVMLHFRRWVDLVPFMESYRQSGLWDLQNYSWRPGDSFNQLEISLEVIPCSNIHRIRRIPLRVYMPYLDAFTLCVITLQRLNLWCSYNLGMKSMNQVVPRHHTFMAKLSRLKHSSSFHILADLLIIVQRLVCDSCYDFFLVSTLFER